MKQYLLNLLTRILGVLSAPNVVQKPPMPETTPTPSIVVPSAPQKPTSRITDWAVAVEHQEGARKDLNNPGDLKVSTLTASWGCKPGFNAQDGGSIGRFDTYEQGFTALCNFLTLGAEDELRAFHHARTLGSFMNVYGNPTDGHYSANIARELGCSVDTPVEELL